MPNLRRLVLLAPLAAAVLITSATPSAGAPTQSSAAPYALTLVSRSGTQREVAVEEKPCKPRSICSASAFSQPDNAVSRASVIRPGERVRILGMPRDRTASLFVGRLSGACPPPTPIASIGSDSLVKHGLKFIPMTRTGAWRANLGPGFYLLNSTFTRRKADGDWVTHSGLLGILVSGTRPLGTVPVPRC